MELVCMLLSCYSQLIITIPQFVMFVHCWHCESLLNFSQILFNTVLFGAMELSAISFCQQA